MEEFLGATFGFVIPAAIILAILQWVGCVPTFG